MIETKHLIDRLKSIGETEAAERLQNLLKSNIELMDCVKEAEKQLTLIKHNCDKPNEK